MEDGLVRALAGFSTVDYLSPLECNWLATTTIPGLKESLRSRVMTRLPFLFQTCLHATMALLHSKFPEFSGELDPKKIALALVDPSITSRPEFRLPAGVVSNARLAYVGDAQLTLFVAHLSYKAGRDPRGHQEVRTLLSQKKALASFHDSFFGDAPCILTWERFLLDHPPTIHQKSEFVEAMIAALGFCAPRAATAFLELITVASARISVQKPGTEASNIGQPQEA
jgi:hypothetical protein